MYPEIVKLIPLPEQTYGGLVSKAILIHAGTKDSSERPGIYITGGMHAREWGISDICITFIENLLTSY